MCGIFGTISKSNKSFNKRAFCTMGVRNDSRGGDSCGVFIDGQVEYGVDKQKLFINFFRDSILLNTTTECKIALGHCRKASVGKVSKETAQPVVLTNETGEIEYVLIHNGTIYNYEELAKKYIPDVDIKGLTDSQVMARIFYYAGYDCLDEYQGGAVFVIHDYRINKTLIFKGHSKKTSYSKEQEEERPLYYCWHNGRFVFSSIFETLYAHYYEEDVYILPFNKLLTVKNDKLKLVKEYLRLNCTQTKFGVITTTTNHATYPIWDSDDEYYWNKYGGGDTYYEHRSFAIQFDGFHYLDEKKMALHGKFYASQYGWLYPNKKKKEVWLHEVAFFQGRFLKCPEAFDLITQCYNANGNKFTTEVLTLINMLDYNPYTVDFVQYYWYNNQHSYKIPIGTWRWPMVNYSCTFDDEGTFIGQGTEKFQAWVPEYKKYVFDKDQIMADLKKQLEEIE